MDANLENTKCGAGGSKVLLKFSVKLMSVLEK